MIWIFLLWETSGLDDIINILRQKTKNKKICLCFHNNFYFLTSKFPEIEIKHFTPPSDEKF